MAKKILTVIGARPQFIKAAAVSRVIREKFAAQVEEVLVHTGQHYDHNMSEVFFEELGIPAPKHNLAIAGGNHGAMTGRMLEAIERVLLDEQPDWVLVYGDTNSTLAGVLAAAKLHIPVAHVEAGLRSFNMRMPEEINRIVTDRLSTRLFCPTEAAIKCLQAEGITQGVFNVGDVMYDVALGCLADANQRKTAILSAYGLKEKQFVLATCHRAENTDDAGRLREICLGLADVATEWEVLLPVHPRTRKMIAEQGLADMLGKVRLVEPLSFLEMLVLEQAARVIVTDSGGVQKEAFFYQVPCVTMRDETEWVETVELGWNTLVGAKRDLIRQAVLNGTSGQQGHCPYGDGRAGEKILEILLRQG